MSTDKEKLRTIKKSISFPVDLWEFIQETKGDIGDNSKVVQKALREMRERIQKQASNDAKKGSEKVKEAFRQKK